MNIIGRTNELRELKKYASSKKPDFLVVYGRRRVGKTFLIKEFFGNEFCFYCTGRKSDETENETGNQSMRKQLEAFHAALNKYGKESYPTATSWFESFSQLEHLIEHSDIPGKKVIFIDEMPWLDTPKSGFLSGLEYFWNSFASSRPDILLIACGSATSWIVKKLFENTGGLYGRITKRMRIVPFSLKESELFFRDRGVVLNRYQIVESQMIFGGIPFYLDLFDNAYALPQNVDRLCFGENALLSGEYNILYATLFRKPETHQRIAQALAEKMVGLTREELLDATGFSNGGRFSSILEDLEQCGFIRSYVDFGKKKKGVIYQLSDAFTLFHHRFLKNRANNDPNFWTNGYAAGSENAWRGYAFEQVCLSHIEQIRKALGISGVSANASAWRSESTNRASGAQIDLVIDRRDQVINLCEMKFSVREFEIDKSYCEKLEHKTRVFSEETRTTKALHTTLVTTYGVKRNKYYHAVQSEVTMNDLFE